MSKTPRKDIAVVPRFRIMRGEDIALGPGKVDLLRHVQATGSISEAARQLGMSYMRAWSLVRTMNACFHEPLVAATRGGHRRGGATLTPTGEQVLALYARLEAESRSATRSASHELSKLLKG